MDVQPPRRDLTQSERRWQVVALCLSVAGVDFMLNVAFLPFSRQLPGPGARYLTLVAVAVVIGSQVAPAGGRVALMLIWAAMGITMALGTIGIFSVGMFYLMAFAMLLIALVISPNRSGLASRADTGAGLSPGSPAISAPSGWRSASRCRLRGFSETIPDVVSRREPPRAARHPRVDERSTARGPGIRDRKRSSRGRQGRAGLPVAGGGLTVFQSSVYSKSRTTLLVSGGGAASCQVLPMPRPTTGAERIPHVLVPAEPDQVAGSWTFVYRFFTNHLPFLAPNRSEPCPAR